MIFPTVLQENYIKEFNRATPQRNLSKPLVAFFAVCQLFFGLNLGFVKSSGILKIATRFATALAGCTITVILILSITLIEFRSKSYLVYLIQYIPICIILRASKYTLSDFLTDLLAKNEKVSPENDTKLGIFLWLYTSIILLAKFATRVVYLLLTSCTNYWRMMVEMSIHIALIALDVIPIVNFVLFYHVYARLKYLRQKYGQQEINLEQLQNSYKQVADDFQKFRSYYDAIFVWGFVTESSKWMCIIWNHLILFRYSNSWWLYGCSYTWDLYVTVEIGVPAVFAEMISVETDAIKMILQEQISVETDSEKFFEMSRLLRYVEARPLLRRAWRLVPLDLQLPVTMLSICITYLIVIIQFSHIYD